MRKDIIYPIFLKCCQYSDDTFWEAIFKDLAYGRAPHGTYISKDCLYGCAKKGFTYKIGEKDAKTVYGEVRSLLKDRLGLLSNREKAKRKKAFSDLENDIKNHRKSWTDIKKKKMRELLLELYAVRMKNKHCLSVRQAQHLLSTVLVAVALKVITANDIHYNRGRIDSINGIDFDREQMKINCDLRSIDPGPAPHVLLGKTMAGNWEKYLDNLRKICEKLRVE